MANYITQPSARVIADSIHKDDRVTTMEVTMHRFVLAEFNTHRAFSRNSASSRAIPGHLQRRRVAKDPAMPIEFPAKQRGMQGGTEIDNVAEAETEWRRAARDARRAAGVLDELGVHKSVTNRLLEPFLFQTIIVTGDTAAYDNFFLQRCSELAQPEIRVPAELMMDAYAESIPNELRAQDWHVPLVLVDDSDTAALNDYGLNNDLKGYELLKRVSAARCARVSYLTHDGKRDIQADLDLYERLVTADPPHWSPLEHVCRPQSSLEPRRGNIKGWRQLRHERNLT